MHYGSIRTASVRQTLWKALREIVEVAQVVTKRQHQCTDSNSTPRNTHATVLSVHAKTPCGMSNILVRETVDKNVYVLMFTFACAPNGQLRQVHIHHSLMSTSAFVRKIILRWTV